MIADDIRTRREELTARREPFVTATVVKVQRPTSAAPGNVALVRSDGALEGFIGGICAQHSVRLYSLAAMESGEPLLLRILPDPLEEDPESVPVTDGHVIDRDEGSVTVRNPCLSGGAIEVFLEPTLPAPRVLVAGDSPIAGALVALGPVVDLDIVVSAGRRDRVQPGPGDLALIVAAHGRDELEVLAAAVDADLPYIGLVASLRRGTAVLEELRPLVADPTAITRIETPAGLDLGATSAGEIALSILARVIQIRRGADAPAAPAAQIATDPICGMTVVVDADTPRAVRAGETFYFCCDGCQTRFAAGAA